MRQRSCGYDLIKLPQCISCAVAPAPPPPPPLQVTLHLCDWRAMPDNPCARQEDTWRREDRKLRSVDYDSHLGVQRDPITRDVIA